MRHQMMLSKVGCALLVLAAGCVDQPLGHGDELDTELGSNAAPLAAGPTLQSRFEGAERVVVGTVDSISAAFGRNEYGDNLIISTVTLQVEQSLRGSASTIATFELEGGTVGDLTLVVSDLPKLRPGSRGVFALRRTSTGSWVPNRRALGILAMTPSIDLRQLRRAEEASR